MPRPVCQHRPGQSAGPFRYGTVKIKPRRSLGIWRSFARDREGSSAVEFGLVALPFMAILLAILETGLVFFASQVIETAVEARAGFLDRPVLAVLVAGTVLVVIAFALVYLGTVKL